LSAVTSGGYSVSVSATSTQTLLEEAVAAGAWEVAGS
jgi:hypothetical protein